MGETTAAADTTQRALAALESLLTAASEAVDALDQHLPHLDDAQRWQAVAAVGELARASDALRVRIAADLVDRHDGLDREHRFPVRCGYRNASEMLQSELGISRRGARALLAVTAASRARVSMTGAEVPARLPVIGEAVRSGAISVEAADAMIGALGDAVDRALPEHVAAAEEQLVGMAVGGAGGVADDADVRPATLDVLAQAARLWRDALDPDGVEPRYEQQLDDRSFTLTQRADGSWSGRIVCTPDQGAVLAAGLDPYTSPRRRPVFADAVDAEADAATESDVEATDTRTRPQQMIDALVAMVGRASELADAPRVGGEAPTVVLTVPHDALGRAAAGEPGVTCTDERTGSALPVHIAAAAMCDGFVQRAVVGTDGVPLQLDRRSRLFSPHQRRALAILHPGCAVRGCTAPVGWCEAHHVRSWADGGATDLDNAILLCRHHHLEVHLGRLIVERGPDGWRARTAVRRPRRRSRFGRSTARPPHIPGAPLPERPRPGSATAGSAASGRPPTARA